MKKRQTNEQIVMDIMRHSRFGALAQIFVMDALNKFAEAVSESSIKDYPENSFVHPASWIGVALEIKEKLKGGDN